MAFYKIIQNGNVVSCCCYFLKWSAERNRVFVSTPDDAQFVPSLDETTIYHDSWMRDVSDVPIPYESAEVVEIDENEFEDIKLLLEGGETVPLQQEEPEPEPEEPESVPTEHPMTVQEMRESILALQEQNKELTEKLSRLLKQTEGDDDVESGNIEAGE